MLVKLSKCKPCNNIVCFMLINVNNKYCPNFSRNACWLNSMYIENNKYIKNYEM